MCGRAEDREGVRGNDNPVDAFGAAVRPAVCGPQTHRRRVQLVGVDAGERGPPVAQVKVIWIRHRIESIPARGASDVSKAIRRGKTGHRPQQHGANDRETWHSRRCRSPARAWGWR